MKFQFFIFIVLLFNLRASFAQSRPKVGLVLSGGGVRGLAHIGVLKAIEKSGLSIDYITGTSMGAVIGGLYAVGYSADSIEKIALSEDWDKLFRNQLSLNSISIEEKEEYNKYISEFEIINNKFQLPNGLIEGQELTLELTKLFSPVLYQRNFKKFAIPFSCLATDISTGRSIILDTGNIVNAIRSSMSIYSIFTPVEINNMLLVDGGITNNLPVNVVKTMGADFVIAVDIGEPLREKKNINSIIDVIMQINSFADLKNYEQQKRSADFLITPNLNGIYGIDFSKIDTIIKRGNQAGMLFESRFKNLKDSLDNIYDIKPIKKTIEMVDTISVAKILFEGNAFVSEKLIMYHMRNIYKKTTSIERINESIKNLYGTRYFRHIRFELLDFENEKLLKLNLQEIPGSYAKLAINYHSFLGASLILNGTFNFKKWEGSKFLISANIGEAPRLKTEVYKYLGPRHKYFFQYGFYFSRYKLPVYEPNGGLTNIYNQNYFGLDVRVSSILTKNAMIGAGIKGEHHIINPEVGLNFLFKRANYTNLNYYLVYNFNSLDNKLFPKKGAVVKSEINLINQANFKSTEEVDSLYSILDIVDIKTFTRPYQQFKYYGRFYTPISRKVSLVFGTQIGFTFGVSHRTIFNDFAIGGMNPVYRNNLSMAGFLDYEFFQPNAIIISEELQYEIYKNVFINGCFNVGSFQSKLVNFISRMDSKDFFVFGGAISVGFNTFLGPVHISAMKGSNFAQDIRFYLNIGHNF